MNNMSLPFSPRMLKEFIVAPYVVYVPNGLILRVNRFFIAIFIYGNNISGDVHLYEDAGWVG